MELVLKGDVPSKKNSRVLTFRNGRMFSFPSKNHKVWHTENMWLIKGVQKQGLCTIEIVFFPSSKRRADLTNKAESVLDLLVDGNVIEDDNWFVVGSVILRFGGVDKTNPRAEVRLTPALCQSKKSKLATPLKSRSVATKN